ncbi:hypothetical protein [Streptomyces liangshanensis]|uniref:hypothetical protein n=1 Tax=Streptomyces liangshanensis TaxID=2717324 RepID=UPI0036DF9E0A
MKKDWLLNGSLVAVLVVLASAEYQLARACGFGTYVAAAVPVALDLYVIKALRVRRDIAAAVLALIAVNAASHLVTASVLPVRWPLIVAVSSIAPLVLWRIHRLGEHPAKDHRAVETPAPVPPPAGDHPPVPPAPQRYGDPVVFRPAPKVVPPGARMLPIVAAKMTTPADTEVTLERVDAEPEQVVTRPAIETGWKPLDWPPLSARATTALTRMVTTPVAAAEPRPVVTVPVAITPTELRKHARKLNREAVTDTGRPVTIERLREEFGLSRREATDLRREVVGSRS